MTFRMAIVDGTGPDTGYEAAMAHSFCRTLGDKLGGLAYYQRGPNTAGWETLPEGVRAAKWLWREHDRDRDLDLMLAGYSRGGSAVILAAEVLEKLDVPVHSMFLFDPVARHIYPGGEVIPANVAFSRAARRDQTWSFVMKYEGTISDSDHLGATSNPIRPSFGNTALNWRGLGDHREPKAFKGSHGALGGVGWAFVTEDPDCQAEVSAWMGEQMRQRGVIVNLGQGSLSRTPPLTPGMVTGVLGKSLDAVLLAKNAIARLGGGWTGF